MDLNYEWNPLACIFLRVGCDSYFRVRICLTPDECHCETAQKRKHGSICEGCTRSHGSNMREGFLSVTRGWGLVQHVNTSFTVPDDYDDLLSYYTKRGYRVIAIAGKSIERLSWLKAQRLKRYAISHYSKAVESQ